MLKIILGFLLGTIIMYFGKSFTIKAINFIKGLISKFKK